MTIAEVAQKYGLSADTLRYYERIGLLPPIGRTAGGIRSYSEIDCNWVSFIKCMRRAGLPLEVLIDYVSLFQQGESTKKARKALLVEQQAALQERIAEMQQTLEYLSYKIDHYDDIVYPIESSLE